jgi:hypothetical protein
MNYRSIQGYLILGAFLSLIVGASTIQAQSSSAPTATPTPSLSAKASPEADLGERLTKLEQEVQELKKPQKDNWDKLSAISGLISGSIIVLVGLFVTSALKKRELAISQVQTVLRFLPQLQSGGPKEKEATLLAIQALDTKSGLALDIASLYRDEGSINAIRKMGSGPDAAIAKRARETLASMVIVSFKYFSPETDDLSLSLSSLQTFYDLTNQVFWALKGAVEPFTYEKSWMLRDKATLKEFRKERTKDGAISRIDLRSLEKVGIKPGMTLEVIPMKIASNDPHPQSMQHF